MRILMPFNKHPYTTALYVKSALERLGHDVVPWGTGWGVEGTRPDDTPIASAYDLFLYVEGATDTLNLTAFASSPVSRVWWAIDNHLHAGIRTDGERLTYGEVPVDAAHQEILPLFSREQDLIVTAQKQTVDLVPYAPFYAQLGANVKHLKLAADVSHRPLDIQPVFDIVFVGNCNPLHLRRRKLLNALKAEFGERMLECSAYGEDMVKALHLGKVVFNCSVVGDLNMRYFEARATGRTLVTDVFLPEDEEIDTAIWVYGDNEKKIVDFVKQAVSQSYNVFPDIKKHTYDARMKELLKMVKQVQKKVKKKPGIRETLPILEDMATKIKEHFEKSDPLSVTLKFPDETTKKAMLAHIANHASFAGALQPDGKVIEAGVAREVIDEALAANTDAWGAPKGPEMLADRYHRLCQEPSDIKEHLPVLCELASECNSVVEMGLRTGVSTTALLYGLIQGREVATGWSQVKREGSWVSKGWMLSLDIDAAAVAAASCFPVYSDPGVRFDTVVGNSLTYDINTQVDLLFIDTLHTGQQLVQELFRHAKHVNKYIVLHDVTTFGYVGEDGQPGLWTAVGRFLASNLEWKAIRYDENCNGLLVLGRR